MKTLIIIFLAVLMLSACTMQRPIVGDRFISTVYQPRTYPILSADTIDISKADNIAAFKLSVPSDATDSSMYQGTIDTLSGIPSGYIKVAPGESISLGYASDMRMDGVRLIIKDKANLDVLKAR